MPNPSLQINWSVWDNNPIVSWIMDGVLVKVSLKLPPIAVAHISKCGMIAIVGDFDEFGPSNLLFYSYGGSLEKSFSAPALGRDARFGGVAENGEVVEVIVSFRLDSIWKEQRGRLNLDDGTITDLHRNY